MSDAVAAPKVIEWCLFFIDWEPICMPRSEWSGWAQAVGSVLALLIAIGAPYLADALERKRLKVSARDAASVFAHNVTRALNRFGTHPDSRPEDVMTTIHADLDVALMQTEAIQLHLLDRKSVDAVRQLIAMAKASHRQAWHCIESHGEHLGLFRATLAEHGKTAAKLMPDIVGQNWHHTPAPSQR